MSDATTAAATEATTLLGGAEGATATTTTATTAAASTTAATAATTTAATQTPEEKAAAEAAAAKAAEVKGAPEKYEDFKLPDAMKADAPLMEKFTGLAKELNLPQGAAQKVVDLAAEMQAGTATQLSAAIEAQAEKWAADSKGDKEFGGAAFDANLALAKTALDQFGTPELKALLNDSKLGNHPEVLRFMVRAGKAIGQDGHIPGRAGAPAASAKAFYANSNMNP